MKYFFSVVQVWIQMTIILVSYCCFQPSQEFTIDEIRAAFIDYTGLVITPMVREPMVREHMFYLVSAQSALDEDLEIGR
jgi:hypothetical protein